MTETFSYKVSIDLDLSADELALLTRYSKTHYDSTCRSASLYRGFIFGWNNLANFQDCRFINVSVDGQSLGTCVKIMEQYKWTQEIPACDLYWRLNKLLIALCAESERVNENPRIVVHS